MEARRGPVRSPCDRRQARAFVGHAAEPLLPSAFVLGTDSCEDLHAPGHPSERIDPLAKTPRAWTGARTPSGLKRVRQAERRHAILQPRRTAAKTFVASALTAASSAGDPEAAAIALAAAHAALDRAAKTGAIHANAAARRKSRLTLKFNAATGGVTVASGRVLKTTSKAQAAKAAKARIAAGKANKAKGAQTAAGKARAAVSKTARAEAAAAATAASAATAETSKAPTKATAAKATTTKVAAKKGPAKSTAAKATARKAPAKKAATKS
jgi:ribosomal protein S20